MAKKKEDVVMEVKPEEQAIAEPAVVETAPEVTLGVSTVNNHEQRIFAIEKKLGLR